MIVSGTRDCTQVENGGKCFVHVSFELCTQYQLLIMNYDNTWISLYNNVVAGGFTVDQIAQFI